MSKLIQNITKNNFSPYGYVLDFSDNTTDEFEIIVKESESPWRMAVYRPHSRDCDFLENHPDSMESFEPTKGISLLIVAEKNTPNNFSVFLLDKPVCLYKGIWHNVMALSEDVLIRVTENLEVESEYHYFDKKIQILIEGK